MKYVSTRSSRACQLPLVIDRARLKTAIENQHRPRNDRDEAAERKKKKTRESVCRFSSAESGDNGTLHGIEMRIEREKEHLRGKEAGFRLLAQTLEAPAARTNKAARGRVVSLDSTRVTPTDYQPRSQDKSSSGRLCSVAARGTFRLLLRPPRRVNQRN